MVPNVGGIHKTTILAKSHKIITSIFHYLCFMRVYFTISELCITGTTVPMDVADKLLKYHITPMNPVREELGVPIHCKTSKGLNSGWRPKQWEFDHGRSGDSQHVFIEKGAIDWRCSDFQDNKDELLRLIIKHTKYTRIAVYGSFIHCDYKATPNNVRQLFTSNASSQWTFIRNVA